MLLQGLLLLLLTLAVVILISGWFKGLSAKELVICINAVCLSIGVVIALSRDRWRRNGDFAGKDRR
jgi:general stress protein CsbA